MTYEELQNKTYEGLQNYTYANMQYGTTSGGISSIILNACVNGILRKFNNNMNILISSSESIDYIKRQYNNQLLSFGLSDDNINYLIRKYSNMPIHSISNQTLDALKRLTDTGLSEAILIPNLKARKIDWEKQKGFDFNAVIEKNYDIIQIIILNHEKNITQIGKNFDMTADFPEFFHNGISFADLELETFEELETKTFETISYTKRPEFKRDIKLL